MRIDRLAGVTAVGGHPTERLQWNLSQKLPCLTYGVQSNSDALDHFGSLPFCAQFAQDQISLEPVWFWQKGASSKCT
jgi:hypothetical protein